MDTLFHFVFPLMAAMAAQVHIKHPVKNLLIAAFLASIVLDLDHFIFIERATFHNLFITLLLPSLLVFHAFHKKASYETKGLSIVLLIFLFSHTVLDVITEPGVALLYPISEEYFVFNPSLWIPLESTFVTEGMLISPLGIGGLVYFVLVVIPCYFLDKSMQVMERQHKNLHRALRYIRKNYRY